MTNSFYMLTPKIEYPKSVAWGRTKKFKKYLDDRTAADRLRQERANAIGRFMKADKRRNCFETKEQAQIYICMMGLPFEVEASEACWAF